MRSGIAGRIKPPVSILGTALLATFILAPSLQAQIPRTVDGHPDFSGTWIRMRGSTPEGRRNVGFAGTDAGVEQRSLEDVVPLQPWAREEFLARMPWDDPQAQGCIPRGAVRYTTTTIFLTDFVQTDDVLYMLFNQHANWRRIYLDGREHPEDITLYYGHSIGRWEGDTLVVDTVGEPENTWLNSGERGLPHTDQLHVVERVRFVEGDQYIEFDMTIEDPGAYTAPMKQTVMWERNEGGDEPDYACEEGLQLQGFEPEPLLPR